MKSLTLKIVAIFMFFECLYIRSIIHTSDPGTSNSNFCLDLFIQNLLRLQHITKPSSEVVSSTNSFVQGKKKINKIKTFKSVQ